MKEEEIVDHVKRNGFYVVKNFFQQEEVVSIKKKLKFFYEKCNLGDQLDLPNSITSNSYSTGKSMRIYPAWYSYFPEFNKFNNESFSKMSDIFFAGCSNKNMQIFSSYETLSADNVETLPRNSYMHVDPYHSFKYFVYLMDTNKENGALQVIPGTSWIGKNIRSENSMDSLLNSDSYTFKTSKYYDKSLEDNILYIEGNAGDCIILDTDTMHCGGVILKEGLERLSIVSHSRK